MSDPRLFLDRAPLFSHFSGDDLDQIAGALSPKQLHAGDHLVRHGDRADGLWVIEVGQAVVRATGARGRQEDVARVGAGEVVGLFSLVQDRRRDADVIAVSDLRAWFLPRSAFTMLWESTAPISLRFQLLVARQLARDARDVQAELLRAQGR
jgi:CRP-like cAMP-binding protein